MVAADCVRTAWSLWKGKGGRDGRRLAEPARRVQDSRTRGREAEGGRASRGASSTHAAWPVARGSMYSLEKRYMGVASKPQRIGLKLGGLVPLASLITDP